MRSENLLDDAERAKPRNTISNTQICNTLRIKLACSQEVVMKCLFF